ncbi:MAG: rhodanese-like domain-containing protein [Anaerolineae bacterium]|nr:rhodanese-like domain-containing protein [Anaerolineae bacterium]MCA9888804.1 rhodanese-like domain-containing protein [Anaerolineae bacterium]MCA9895353.1 rhodanese-like domain-containing protein [Anaerolineae bacterium]MCB9458224.1 rhodanese-like domain-containing protein [Anaerolineaceae bacterium]
MDQPYQDIDIETFRSDFVEADRNDYILLDVREEFEYAGGHIPNAVNIPMSAINARIDDIPQDKPVIIVCATGNRSAYLAEALAPHGWNNLYNLLDGTMGWMMRGLPTE